jgi:hypothetical protein
MRKSLLIIVFTSLLSISGFGQYNLDYGFSVGASNYLGELGGGEGVGRGFISDMEMGFTRWTIGGFVRYKLSPKFAIKGSLNYIRLSGDDVKSTNPARTARNLNFKNDMFEFLGTGEFYIYRANDVGGTGRYNTDFNLYLFGGAGVFFSSPKGQSTTGEWVSLKPLATEGASYSSINLAIPMGIGFYYTLQRKYRIGLEIGWRTTFTDYIDDISDVYANDEDGISNKTSQGLIDQINKESGSELGDPTYISKNSFIAGKKRGNPDNNDSYMTATVNFSWAIRGKSKFYKSRHSWVLGKKKRRRRKSRAKF